MKSLIEKELECDSSKIDTEILERVYRYGPTSNENLQENFSKLTIEENDLRRLEKENEKLKSQLKLARKKTKSKNDKISCLQNQLFNDVTYSRTMCATSDYQQDLENQEDVEVEEDHRTSGEVLYSHFSEVIRRYHDTLREKDLQIQELQERLGRCEERQFHSHPHIVKSRLDRTEAAVRVFHRDLSELKVQLDGCPLREEKFLCSTSRERIIVRELRRRQRFGAIADLEKMGKRFLQKIKFEEKLDRLHWKLEMERLREHKEQTQNQCSPSCCYDEEFEKLQTTRNNLLRRLKDLRARHTDPTATESSQGSEENTTTGITITTVQSLYKPSEFTLATQSAENIKTNEFPEK